MKLLQPLFFSLSFFYAVNSEAQLLYTDIVPDTIVSADTVQVIKSYYVDLDNSGGYEIELRHFNPGGGFAATEIHNSANAQVLLDNDGHAKVLAAGDPVNSNGNWGNDGNGILNDPWYGGGDKFFAVRFMLGGQWRYGWVRVVIAASKLSFTVKDYGYDATANQGVIAGSHFTLSVTTGIDKEDSGIYPNPSAGQFSIRTKLSNYSVSICDMNGRLLFSSTASGSGEIILPAELQNGVYLIKLSDAINRPENFRLLICR